MHHLKDKVVEHYLKFGGRASQLAKMFNVKRRTINDWILEQIDIENKSMIKHEPFGSYKYHIPIQSDFGPGSHAELKLDKNITKTVVLSDLHMPYHIDLSGVMDFISDFKPDYIILNGDIADWDCFSPHDPMSLRKPLSFADQKNLCMDLIKQTSSMCKNLIWVQGNHEDWARQAALKNPSLAGTIEQHHWLPPYITYVPLNHSVLLGKLRILHGNCLRNESVAMPTRSMLQQWSSGHLLFGHYHKRETYTQVSEIGSEKRYAEMSACLCTVNPSYTRNRPNAVSNGFCYIISEKDGNYWPTFPSIHHSKFVAEGKVYESKNKLKL